MIDVPRCPKHGTRLLLEVDAIGQLVSHCTACQRRRAHQCIDCGRQLATQAHRCPSCMKTHKNALANRTRARYCRNCGGPVKPGSKRQYCCDDCFRTAKNRRYVERYHKPENAEKVEARNARKRTWFRTTAGILSRHRSQAKGRISGTWGYPTREAYLAAMAEQNARPHRVERHREWAHLNQTRYAGTGEVPRCATCGCEVPWDGRGRPRKYCPPHHPWRKQPCRTN